MTLRIVMAARGWIGTPYVHQASCRGAGADCLGLIRGVPLFLIGVLVARLPVTRLTERQALPLAAASLAIAAR